MLGKTQGRTKGKAERECWSASEGIYITYCRAGICCESVAMVARQCTWRSCEGDELTALNKQLEKKRVHYCGHFKWQR